MKDLEEFVEQRLLWADMQAQSGPSLAHSTTSTHPSPTTHPSTSPQPHSSPKMKSATPTKCASCGEAHWLGRCLAFAALDTEARNRLVREKRLCLNCLTPAHVVKQCNSRHTCRHCNARHHSLLHRDFRPSASTLQAPPAAPPTVAVVDSPDDGAKPASVVPESGYFTCTVVARLQHEGACTRARVLLDHGSGGSFISEELATQLRLPRHAQDRTFQGFGEGTVRSRFKVFTSLCSTTSTFTTQPIELSVVAHALHTSPPADREAVLNLAEKQGLTLSDSLLGGRVDVILGGEHPWDICGEVSVVGRHRFIATKLGYGVVGPLTSHTSVLTIMEHPTSLQDDLVKLWALDRVPEASAFTPEEQATLDFYHRTTTLQDGRVQVCLPFKDNAPPLGDSRRQALSRFFNNVKFLQAKGKIN